MPTAPAIDDAVDAAAPTTRSRAIKLGLGLVGTGAVLAGVVAFGGESEPEPELLFREALNRLDGGDYRRAANIARYLQARNYQDLNFGGGVSYTLGLSAFELGDRYSVDRHTERQHYVDAARNLTRSFEEGLVMDRRPRWAAATGLSLFRLGRLADAERRLEEALASQTDSPESDAPRSDASSADAWRPVSLALATCDLVPSVRTPRRLDRAVGLCDAVLADAAAAEDERQTAWLLRAEATLARDGVEAADTWMAETPAPPRLADNPRRRLLQSRIDIEAGRTDAAMASLRAVLRSPLDPPETAREAAFLMGRIHEQAGDEEAAILAYRRVVDDYDPGDETVVAAVRLGDLLRSAPRSLHEAALDAYAVGVEIPIEPGKFRNKYASLDDLRNRVRAAWQSWLDGREYPRAIELADRMSPLFVPSDAADMKAEATRAAAAAWQARSDAAGGEDRRQIAPTLYAAWRASGRAYAELADARRSQSGYPDALWISARHFAAGHDFQSAFEQTQAFLETHSPTRRPQAMVQAGRLLMSLHRPGDDRLDEATGVFETMLADFPAADAGFDARYALGECALERDDLIAAETHWRSILDSQLLSPSGRVWQDALVSLGELMFHTGETLALRARKAAETPEVAARARQKADARWAAAVRRLSGYLARTPQTPRAAEARFWLAKSLQRTTELPRLQLASAETNNARLELERQIETSLKRALDEFATLVAALSPVAERGQIGPVQSRLLRDSVFEIPHTHFLLGQWQDALDGYADATTRFPDDPQVLLSYVQSARCLNELGRRAEARAQLARASVIREALAEDQFTPALTSFSGPEWDLWLERTRELMTPPAQTAG